MATKKAKKVSYYQICTGCGKELPLSSFYRDGSNKQGPRYRKDCKECYTKTRKERDLAKTLPEVIEMTPVRKLD